MQTTAIGNSTELTVLYGRSLKTAVGALCAVLFSLTTVSADAALFSRLGGAAAYDDVLDITWTTNANINGVDNWSNQVAWAAGFSLGGFDDWRLASMSVAAGLPTGVAPSGTVANCFSATELACRDNELSYMFYYTMGGNFGDNKSGDQTVDGVLLTDVGAYWSGTVSGFNLPDAHIANFVDGSISAINKNNNGFSAWAVRAGDVVPEPAAILLFGSGMMGLLLRRRRLS